MSLSAGTKALLPLWHPGPAFHIKAPRAWLNDPCGPAYDVTTGLYHVFYQWNPRDCDWGHICWGHLTSTDGVFWEHDGTEPVLRPTLPYDKEGIFTGCVHPTGPDGKPGQLTAFYTSVCALPFHWTKPYPRNAAGLALATSIDGGTTWQKSELNPILAGEPEGMTVTGFRDPYMAAWPAMDKVRGKTSLYGTISGGIRDHGPRAFLYAIDSHNMSKWEHIGALLELPSGYCPSRKWNGDFGVNWECANFMTLKDGSEEREFAIIGSEGGLQREHLKVGDEEHIGWCMWVGGKLQKKYGVWMEYELSGVLDHGCFYAANSFDDPKSGKRIVWGWLKEEDLALPRREAKGWTGHLSLQRELSYHKITNVVRAIKTPLSEISSVLVKDNDGGTKTLQTMGIRPLSDLKRLRQDSPPLAWSNLTLPSGVAKRLTQGSNWNMEASISLTEGCESVGFHIQHNDDLSQKTTIYFSYADEEIFVDRSLSNSETDVRKTTTSGPFTLFTFRDKGKETVEKLHLQIFCDGDIVEIFANGRFALSTMVYGTLSTNTGVSCFGVGAESDSVVFCDVRIWQDLKTVTKLNNVSTR